MRITINHIKVGGIKFKFQADGDPLPHTEWSLVLSSPIACNMYTVSYGADLSSGTPLFLYVCQPANQSKPDILISTDDGATWQPISSDLPFKTTVLAPSPYTRLKFSYLVGFYMIGNDAAVDNVVWTLDGSQWYATSPTSGLYGGWRAVADNGDASGFGLFVAVAVSSITRGGTSGHLVMRVLGQIDGVTWDDIITPVGADGDYQAVSYGELGLIDYFVACASNGKTMWSDNLGDNWVQGSSIPGVGLDINIVDLVYYKGKFVALSTNGKIYNSVDGKTGWTLVKTLTAVGGTYSRLIIGDNVILTENVSNKIALSSNGDSEWTEILGVTGSGAWTDAAFGLSHFVIVSVNRRIQRSN